eukprot:gene16349-biopygen8862
MSQATAFNRATPGHKSVMYGLGVAVLRFAALCSRDPRCGCGPRVRVVGTCLGGWLAGGLICLGPVREWSWGLQLGVQSGPTLWRGSGHRVGAMGRLGLGGRGFGGPGM